MLCRFRFALEKEKGNMNLQGQDKIAKMTYCNHSIFMLVYLYHLCSNKRYYTSLAFRTERIIINYTFHKRLSWSGKITVTIASSCQTLCFQGETNFYKKIFRLFSIFRSQVIFQDFVLLCNNKLYFFFQKVSIYILAPKFQLKNVRLINYNFKTNLCMVKYTALFI